jgi:hypothetical protein
MRSPSQLPPYRGESCEAGLAPKKEEEEEEEEEEE